MTPARNRVSHLPAVPGVNEIAVQSFGGRAQAVTCLQVLLIGAPTLHVPLIAQRCNRGVGGLGARGRKLVLKILKTCAERERQRLGQYDGGDWLEILART